jgi:DNA helicase-2/ATP-dependent DNA helicase PcrA
MQADHARYQDFAILYRTNSQSRALEEALRRRNLPYVIYSGNSFFERAEVKDMMAYLKLAVNVNDDESFKRVVNMPARGIGETSLGALASMARSKGISLFKAAYSEDFADYGLKAPAVARIRVFCNMISDYASKSAVTDAHELAVGLSDASGLYAHFKADTSIEGQSRTSNIEELLNSIQQFVEERQDEYLQEMLADRMVEDVSDVDYPVVTVGEFLENVSLLTGVDMEDDEDTNNKIALMTVHSAKGLEFPYVIVSGLEENLFPSSGMLGAPNEIEEERRLFYVAITRAKKSVLLSYANTRMRNGKHESNSPSRFIREIDPRYISNPLRGESGDPDDDDDDFGFRRGFRGFGSGRGSKPSGTRFGMPTGGVKYIPKPKQTTVEELRNRPLPPKIPDSEFVPVPMTEFRTGQRIEHNRFGFGKILEISGNVPDLKAKIVFDDYGEKILLLKYAKMRFAKTK